MAAHPGMTALVSYDPCDDGSDDEPQAPDALPSASASATAWRRARVRPRPLVRSRRAFHRFYREHFGLVWSMVRRFGVPSAQHEDAVQEVWIVAHRRLHTLEPDASAKAWLSSITRRVASRLRRTDHRQRRKLAALELAAARPPGGPVPGPLDGHDARRLLDALLAELDDDQRDVLVLAQIHGLTGPEIAQVLEIPLNTAYSRLRLARRRVDRFAAELGAERSDVLGAMRRGEEPPPRAAARAWVLLVPQLGLGGGAGVVGSGVAGVLSSTKAVVLVVGAGLLGLGVARGIVDARASASAPSRVSEVAAPALVTAVAAVVDEPEASSPVVPEGIEGEAIASAGEQAAHDEVAGPSAARPRRGDRRAMKRAPVSAEAPPTSPTDEADPLQLEADLIARAQQALRTRDAAAALRLLGEHERRFPAGELTDARRGARARALCALGRTEQARAEVLALQRDRPGSPVAAGVADVCAPSP